MVASCVLSVSWGFSSPCQQSPPSNWEPDRVCYSLTMIMDCHFQQKTSHDVQWVSISITTLYNRIQYDYKLYIYIYSGNTWKKHIDFIVMMCTVMPLLVLLLRHAVWNDTLQRLNATTALLSVNKQRQCKCEPSLQQYRRISVWAVDFS